MSAGCQPSMVFMVVRNGRRTPTDEELNNFEQRLPVLRQRILQSQSSKCHASGYPAYLPKFDGMIE